MGLGIASFTRPVRKANFDSAGMFGGRLTA